MHVFNERHENEETCLLWKVFSEEKQRQDAMRKVVNQTSVNQLLADLNIGIFKTSYHRDTHFPQSLVMLNISVLHSEQLQSQLRKGNVTLLIKCGIPELAMLVLCEMKTFSGYDCSSGKWYTLNANDITVFNANNDTMIYRLPHDEYIRPHFLMYYALYEYVDQLGYFTKTMKVVVCGELTLFCPMVTMVTLNASEFTLRLNSSSTSGTTIEVNGEILFPDEFMLVSNGEELMICHSTYECIMSLNDPDVYFPASSTRQRF